MSTFEFTSPDGKTYELDGPEGATPEAAFKLLQVHLGQQAPVQPPAQGLPPTQQAATSMLQNMATGFGQGTRDLIRGVTGGAQIIGNPLSALINKLTGSNLKSVSAGLESTMDAAGLPQSDPHSGLSMTRQFIAGMADPTMKLLGGAAGVKPVAPVPAGVPSEAENTINAGKKLGYSYTPSQTNAGIGSDVLESIARKDNLEKTLSFKNQSVTDAWAKKEAGLLPEQNLNDTNLKQAIDATATQGYDPVRQLPSIQRNGTYNMDLLQILKQTGQAAPGAANAKVLDLVKNYWNPQNLTGDKALAFLQKLRSDANKAALSTEPGSADLAAANKGIANALENLIETNIAKQYGGSAKGAQMLSEFRAARTQMAKQYAVKDALVQGSGSVDASKLAASLQKGDRAFTGPLQTIAQNANVFPRSNAFSMEKPPVLDSRYLIYGGAGGLGAGMLTGMLGGSPTASSGVGTIAAAAALLSPAARALLASRMYQNAFIHTPQPGLGSALGNLLPQGATPMLNATPTMLGLGSGLFGQ